ncbi:MAG: tetratricopeptide repeat protein [Chitinophagales bacterium]|nr:tetratricopeptide repeat protein [Chitinophagales bacterium]
MKKELLFSLLFLMPLLLFSQNNKYIVVQSEAVENVQELAKIYEVEPDSIRNWNDLYGDIIPAGTKIGIFNYNNISNEKIRLNQIDLIVESLNKELNKIEEDYQVAFNKLEKQKMEVDANSPYAMQEYLDISKAKFDLKNKRNEVSEKIIQGIEKLKKEKEQLLLKIEENKLLTDVDNETEIEVATSEQENDIKKETSKKEKKNKKETVEKQEEKGIDNNTGYDLEYLDFSNEVAPDTSSNKYKKEQAKLSKKLKLEESNEEFDKTVMIEEVAVSYKKKKTKYKIGDEVDEIRQDKAKFFLSRAMLEIDKGNLKKANSYIGKSIDLNPSYTEAYMLNGDLWASLGYYDKALKEYERASITNGRIPQVYYNMGNCYIFLKKKEKAIEMMSLAIDVDSTYVLAYSGRSALYIDKKEYQNALNDYESLLAINKYFYPALKGKGIANFELGNYEEAIIDFNKLIEYEDKDPSIYYHRGMAKVHKGDVYAACMDFLKSSERGYSEADKAIKKYCD